MTVHFVPNKYGELEPNPRWFGFESDLIRYADGEIVRWRGERYKVLSSYEGTGIGAVFQYRLRSMRRPHDPVVWCYSYDLDGTIRK